MFAACPTIELRKITGDVIAHTKLDPDAVAVAALKEVLAARLDEDDEVLHSFLYDGALIWESALVRDLGFPTDGVAEICVVVDSRASFQWKHCTIGEGFISEDGAIYHRGETSSTTNGVRAAAPLPRGARCHLTFKSVGSHACFGVGTKIVQLSERRYSSLYGQDEESWAVVFGIGERTRAYHAKQEYEIQTRTAGLPLAAHDRRARITNGGRDCVLPVSFLLGDDGSLSFWLPGADHTAGLEGADEEALVVPFNVPQDKRVYVVASTVYGLGMIAISQAPITPDDLIPKSLPPPPDQAEPEAGKSKDKGKRKGKGKGKGNNDPAEFGKAKGKQKSKDNHQTEAGKAKGKTAKSKDVGSAPQQVGKGKGKRKSKDTGHEPPGAGKAKSKGKSKEPPEAGKAKGEGVLPH